MIHRARNAARDAADRDVRCRVLADCAEALMAGDATARDYVLLAAAWQDADELDAAHHYLEHARAFARDADDRCFAAAGYLRLGDRDAARATLLAAEATADGALAWCTIATAWRHPLGELDRQRDCLSRARAAATRVDDIELAMRAWEPPDADAWIADAEALATTAADWLRVAGAWGQLAMHPDEVTRCLSRAALLGASEADIELARYRWTGGVYTERPLHARLDAFLLPGARSFGWTRDRDGLFDHLRAGIRDERLQRVAENDYGWQAAENLAELRAIVATGRVPRPLWQTLEVLQLERWTDAGSPLTDLSSRALACVLLLVDDVGGGSGLNEGNESTLAILIDSCLALGDDVIALAIGFLAAVADALPAGAPLVLFVELALAIVAAHRDASDPRIAQLVARLDDDERAVRATAQHLNVTPEWVLGVTHFNSRHDVWRRLAAQVPELATRLSLTPYDDTPDEEL